MRSTAKSAELLVTASHVIPGSVNSGRRNMRSNVCMKHASGARFVDVDNNEYIDYHAAFGPVLLGHSYPAVTEAVCKAIQSHVCFGVSTTPAEVALAEKIVADVPSIARVLLCGSGAEATMHAIRVARAFTGRRKIVIFRGAYHGFHDYVLPSAGSVGWDQTVMCSYNELDTVQESFAAHGEDIAAVLVEPILHNSPGAGIVPDDEFLQGLARLCHEHGAVLVFDEVITGFRHALGGYQSIVGVQPDLTTLGKALGNGFPIAAIGGREDIMDRFDTHPDGDVAFAGTYNGNGCSVAAALATLHVLENEPVYDHLFALGDRMRAGLQAIADRAGVAAHAGGFGSLFALSFFDGPARTFADLERNDTDLYLAYRSELVARGIFEVPENVGRSHISYSHTADDIDNTLEIAEGALARVLHARTSSGRSS